MILPRLSQESKVRFFLELARGVETGLSPLEAVQPLLHSKDSSVLRVGVVLDKKMAAKQSLSMAMKGMGRVFTPFQIHRIAGAEASGTLGPILRQLAEGEEQGLQSGLSHESKVRFFRELAVGLDAGLSYAQMLQFFGQDHDPVFARVARSLERRVVEEGRPVFAAMKVMGKIFSPFQIEMMAIGDRSGKLTPILTALAEEEEHSYRLRRKFRSVLVGPCITAGLVAFLLVVGLPLLVFRAYLELIEGMSLPETGWFAFLVQWMRFTQTPYWWGGLLGCGALAVLIFRSEKLREQFLRSLLRALSGLPGVGEQVRLLYRKGQSWEAMLALFEVMLQAKFLQKLGQVWVCMLSSRLAYALGLQLDAGVHLISALESSVQVTGSPLWGSYKRRLVDSFKETGALDRALEELPGCPHLLSSMIYVGEETGTLALVCRKTAALYRDEFERYLEISEKLLEPLVFLVLGLLVVFFAVLMLLPMQRVMSAL